MVLVILRVQHPTKKRALTCYIGSKGTVPTTKAYYTNWYNNEAAIVQVQVNVKIVSAQYYSRVACNIEASIVQVNVNVNTQSTDASNLTRKKKLV